MNRIGKVKHMCHEWYASIMKRSNSHCHIGCMMMNIPSSRNHWNSQKAKTYWIGEHTGNQSYGRLKIHHNDKGIIMSHLDYNHHDQHHKHVHVICKTTIHHENHSLRINIVMYPMMQDMMTMDIPRDDNIESHFCQEQVGQQVNPLNQETHPISIDGNHINKQDLYIYSIA